MTHQSLTPRELKEVRRLVTEGADVGELAKRLHVTRKFLTLALGTAPDVKSTKPITKRRPPIRPKGPKGKPFAFNLSRRPRGEELTKDEVEGLCKAALNVGRKGHRDSTMIHIAFVHGLRVSELVNLKLEQYDFNRNVLHVTRVKNGSPSQHTVERREKEAIKKLMGERRQGYVFLTERGEKFTANNVGKIVARAGREMTVKGQDEPGIGFPVHPHMLRHACGYHLHAQGHSIRAIQVWLGHKNIHHTETYTKNSPEAFKNFRFD